MSDSYFPIFTRRALLGGSEETTSGTMQNITAPLASTAVYDAVIEPLDWFSGTLRTPHGLYDGTVRSPAGMIAGRLRFWTEYRHGDQCLPMLTACGYRLSGGIYRPTTDFSHRKTWSFRLQKIGNDGGTTKAAVFGLAGCAGNVSVEIIAGSRLVFRWEFLGIWQEVVDSATVWSQAPISTLPFMAKTVTFTLGGAAAPHTDRIVFSTGNAVGARESCTASTGIAHYLVESRRPTATINPEARLVAQNDQYGSLLAGTEQAISVTLTSGANSLVISAPKAQRIQIGSGSSGNRAVEDITLALNASSGDDELSFQAT